MVKSSKGIPKPRKEDLIIDDGSEQEEWRKYKKTDDSKPKPVSKWSSHLFKVYF